MDDEGNSEDEVMNELEVENSTVINQVTKPANDTTSYEDDQENNSDIEKHTKEHVDTTQENKLLNIENSRLETVRNSDNENDANKDKIPESTPNVQNSPKMTVLDTVRISDNENGASNDTIPEPTQNIENSPKNTRLDTVQILDNENSTSNDRIPSYDNGNAANNDKIPENEPQNVEAASALNKEIEPTKKQRKVGKPGTFDDKEEPPKKKKKKTPEKIKLPKKKYKAKPIDEPSSGKRKTRGEKRLILLLNFSRDQCFGSGSCRIRIIWPDPHQEMLIWVRVPKKIVINSHSNEPKL